MPKVLLDVKVNDEMLLGKIAEIKEHLNAINDIIFHLRLDGNILTIEETASPVAADETAQS